MAGTQIPTSTIAEYVWEGYSLSDICMFHPELCALAIFNACWFEAKYGKWQSKWFLWVRQIEPYLEKEEIEDIALPPQKLEFLHTPYTFLNEIGVKVRNSWLWI